MKRLTLIAAMILAATGTFLLAGCYKDVILPDSASSGSGSSSGSGTTTVPADSVTFAKYIVPLFSSNCTTCHSGNESPDLRAANAYNALTSGKYVVSGDAASSVLYQKVSSGEMPPGGGLKQSDVDLIKNWINNGALNN
ncbi:Planctomycete cytochrome C [Chitinophaga costaii]|uniref:Planctomycete cytochrome C n=1 Tax=Chitinophaga costaii TaxID=1335309 RepID=A0A1C4CWN3_9BACT|nr:c-type cytochrome domain-containing protein [Chitinophaga costaii]PUZ26913.1 hypothetical protein DCM91_06635 [Chitinophaga costaii]SCC23469.1 Planctomycete cytochrome C [Chitinophaga costaii]